VNENVVELRRYLGSAVRELSLAGLARVLNERDSRQRSASAIQRWEDGAEPDLGSIAIMSELAGVTFEEFALGTGAPQAKAKISEGGIPAPRPSAAKQQKKKPA
jgi:hypothetical protein